MTVKVVGLPQLTLLDVVLLSRELGVRVDYVLVDNGPVSFRCVKPPTERYKGQVMILYTNSVEMINANFSILNANKYLVLLRLSVSSLVEYGIDSFKDGLVSVRMNDLKSFITRYDKLPDFVPMEKSKNLAEEVLFEKNKGSLLQKLQNAFYRIRDTDERKVAQARVYAYLSGSRPFSADSGYDFLNKIISTEFAKNFRKAVVSAKRSGDPDTAGAEFGIDRFEIAFVLSKVKNESRH